MAAATSVPLTLKNQAALMEFYRQAQDLSDDSRETQRRRYTRVDLAYQREQDKSQQHDKAKAANRSGDPSRYQNVTVPVVMPQVEAAVVYQTSVFLTGSPLFGVVSSPEFADEALQLASVIDEQAIKGGWVEQFNLFFRDAEKYNFAPLEVSWTQETVANLDTDASFSLKEGKPSKVIWTGNRVKRLDPYNTFVDPRVDPTEIHKKGEFAGYTESMSRIELKQFIADLPDVITQNVRPAFESGLATTNHTDGSSRNYFIPEINPDIDDPELFQIGTNWMAWAEIGGNEQKIQYKDNYEVTTIYVRILPQEFNIRVPMGNTPQVWKLVIVNHEVIIYSERQTNAHQLIPILIGQPKKDGLRYQTKSTADHAEPFQHVASTFMNSMIHSRRRAISDRTLYDPSRIDAAAINSPNPSAKIPVRPAAYGKNIAESVYAFPYREDQGAFSMAQVRDLIGLSNNLAGQNAARQGQFVKGNKTLEEFDTVMQNANGRDQMASILYEAQIFTPLKQILKYNILQYQGGTTVYNRDAQKAIEIDPVKLRKAVLDFKISDGLTPSSKLMNAESFSVALQTLASSPQIGQGYNIAPLFSYLMKSRGADISDFEKSPEQQAYEQAVGQWQQVVLQAIEQGADPEKLPPQPKPADYGYDPSGKAKQPGESNEQQPPNQPGVQ